MIKTVLAMRKGVLPKTLHVDEPSSKVEWSSGAVELLTEAEPWPESGRPRRAGVSSFGISGTNVHAILEEGPSPVRVDGEGSASWQDDGERPLPGPLPFVLSAKSEQALAEQAERLAAHIRENPGLEPIDMAFSLATTRSALERRAVLVDGSGRRLLSDLAALAEGRSPDGAATGRSRAGRLAWLFTGQGSQRPGMGRELHDAHPVYRETFDEVAGLLDARLGGSLADLVFCEPGTADAARLAHTSRAQAALFATQVALARLLESLGVRPDLLCGHSVGEISAAHLAGVLSLEDAATLVSARGALMGELPEGGEMVAIEATEGELEEALKDREAEVSIAAINGPRAVVLSGVRDAVAGSLRASPRSVAARKPSTSPTPSTRR